MPETVRWTPSARELDDLELLGAGALPARLVVADPAGASPTLRVDASVAEAALDAGSLDLLDPEGLPLARLTVDERADVDGGVLLGGEVQPLAHAQFGPFRRYQRAPGDLPAGERVVLPLEAPPTDTDLQALADAATGGATPLLLALVGTGSPRDISGPALVRACLAAAITVPGAEVVAVPLARRDDPAADTELRSVVAAAYGSRVLLPDYAGEHLPSVAAVLAQDRPPRERAGVVVFLTGLSGSGKSTIARGLHDVLLERGDRTVTSLDGDVVRHHLSSGLGFSRADRETNIERIGWVAAEISRHAGLALCSPIAPFDATRQRVRAMVDAAGGGFVLVHVATPLEECERRDRKGLYARARAGEIPDFTGISSPYEEPEDADLRLDTTGRDLDECIAEVVDLLTRQGWLAPTPGVPVDAALTTSPTMSGA